MRWSQQTPAIWPQRTEQTGLKLQPSLPHPQRTPTWSSVRLADLLNTLPKNADEEESEVTSKNPEL